MYQSNHCHYISFTVMHFLENAYSSLFSCFLSPSLSHSGSCLLHNTLSDHHSYSDSYITHSWFPFFHQHIFFSTNNSRDPADHVILQSHHLAVGSNPFHNDPNHHIKPPSLYHGHHWPSLRMVCSDTNCIQESQGHSHPEPTHCASIRHQWLLISLLSLLSKILKTFFFTIISLYLSQNNL